MKKRKNALRGTVVIAGVTLYTVQEIAQTFGVNSITILRHIKKGDLIARQIGHKYFVVEENLRVFLSAHSIVKGRKKETVHS
ncbi:MAG: helix-turn-helix domain-containing protein [bacterium]